MTVRVREPVMRPGEREGKASTEMVSPGILLPVSVMRKASF
jgi:hypothetical protein